MRETHAAAGGADDGRCRYVCAVLAAVGRAVVPRALVGGAGSAEFDGASLEVLSETLTWAALELPRDSASLTYEFWAAVAVAVRICACDCLPVRM